MKSYLYTRSKLKLDLDLNKFMMEGWTINICFNLFSYHILMRAEEAGRIYDNISQQSADNRIHEWMGVDLTNRKYFFMYFSTKLQLEIEGPNIDVLMYYY